MNSPLPVLLLALLVRLLHRPGFVFSDDAHYLFVARFGEAAYEGYPIMPLRVAHIGLLRFAESLFGPGDFAWTLFPLLLSLLAVLAVYRIGRLLTGQAATGAWAALLLALVPVEAVMAGTAFADTGAAACIAAGIWLLVESEHGRRWLLWPGALLLGLSLLFKMIALWLLPLLAIAQLAAWITERREARPLSLQPALWAAGCGIVLVLAAEAAVYHIDRGDALHRFRMQALNHELCPDDFFKPGSARGYETPEDRGPALARLLLERNPRSLLLRRTSMGLPLLALLAIATVGRRRAWRWVSLWFLGLLLLFWGGTTSFSSWQPLPMDLPWYILPLLAPAALLGGALLAEQKMALQLPALCGFAFLSAHGSGLLRDYLAVEDCKRLRAAFQASAPTTVHTDGFSLYALRVLAIPALESRIGFEDTLLTVMPEGYFLRHRQNRREWRAMGHRLLEPQPEWPLQRVEGGAGMSYLRFGEKEDPPWNPSLPRYPGPWTKTDDDC